MALSQGRRREYVRKQIQIDRPPVTDVADSIREMRRVYKDYNDTDFAAWYSVRYGVRMEAVLAIVKGGKTNVKRRNDN